MITQQVLKEHVRYCSTTGKLFWIKPGRKRQINAEVGSPTVSGYRETCINRHRYLVHRLVWLYHTGEFPPEHTDHINGDRLDNRIENLRAVSNLQNNYNQGKRNKITSSKYRGVTWNRKRNKWIAKLKYNNRHITIGQYIKEEDAALAWNTKAVELYGEFARLNVVELEALNVCSKFSISNHTSTPARSTGNT